MRYLIALALLASLNAAHAKGNAHIWPQYTEDESLASIPPMGVWIDESK